MAALGQPLEFGHPIRAQFLFDSKWINLNHGSFGCYPVPVRNAKRGYLRLTEACPDKFLRYQYTDLLDKSRARIAELVHAPVDECVFVANATTGINTVLRNLTYEEKDVIIYFDTIYGAIERTLLSVAETHPQLTLRKVGHGQSYAYALPMSHAEICSAFSQTISRLLYEGYNIKAAIFDTIASFPGVRFPFERLTKMCKEYNILSIIDGAHGVGHIPLNLKDLDADFFVSNCHKWLFTPRGCAVLHVPMRNQHLIRTTLPTSESFVPESAAQVRSVLPPSKKSRFVNLFQYVGTLDSTAYYCVPAALNFRENLCGGEEMIMEYIRDNAQRGADLLASLLGTEVMDDSDPGAGLKAMGSYEGSTGQQQLSRKWVGGLRDCAMSNVLLPITVLGASQNGSVRLGPGGAGSGGGLAPGLRQHSKGISLSIPSPTSSSHYSPSFSPATVARLSPSFSPLTSSPVALGDLEPTTVHRNEIGAVIEWMQYTLVHEFNTFVAVYAYNDKLWTRLSGQLYLELKDYEWLAGVLKGLIQRVGMGEFVNKTSAPPSRKVSDIDLEKLGRVTSELNLDHHGLAESVPVSRVAD